MLSPGLGSGPEHRREDPPQVAPHAHPNAAEEASLWAGLGAWPSPAEARAARGGSHIHSLANADAGEEVDAQECEPRAAAAYLRSRPDTADDRIVYFGKSLGTAVAVQLAVEEPPDRLVLQSGFTSIQDVASWRVPLLPLGALLHTRFPTIERVDRVRAPILVIHGDRDPVVPLAHGRLLYEAAAEPKCLLIIDGAGHDDVASIGGQRYLELLREFTGPQLPSSSSCRAERFRA